MTVKGTATATPGPETLNALTGLRILAAAWMVMLHFREPLFTLLGSTAPYREIVKSGNLGVEVFFVLSGFVISHNYAHRFQASSKSLYVEFIIARFARLYPIHLATLLFVGALMLLAAKTGVEVSSTAIIKPGTLL